jgi:hypothetical protein
VRELISAEFIEQLRISGVNPLRVRWNVVLDRCNLPPPAAGAQQRRRQEVRMFPSLSSLALAATLLLAAADKVPNLDVEPGCRAAAKMGDSVDSALRQCLADEKGARDELEKEWAQFSPELRARCVATTRSGGDPSYVEVLVCMQMGRDAARMEKSSTGRPQGN